MQVPQSIDPALAEYLEWLKRRPTLIVVETKPDTTEMTEEGVLLYVKGEDKLYLCTTEKWRKIETTNV